MMMMKKDDEPSASVLSRDAQVTKKNESGFFYVLHTKEYGVQKREKL